MGGPVTRTFGMTDGPPGDDWRRPPERRFVRVWFDPDFRVPAAGDAQGAGPVVLMRRTRFVLGMALGGALGVVLGIGLEGLAPSLLPLVTLPLVGGAWGLLWGASQVVWLCSGPTCAALPTPDHRHCPGCNQPIVGEAQDDAERRRVVRAWRSHRDAYERRARPQRRVGGGRRRR